MLIGPGHTVSKSEMEESRGEKKITDDESADSIDSLLFKDCNNWLNLSLKYLLNFKAYYFHSSNLIIKFSQK